MNIKDYTENLADNIGKELKDKQKALKFDNTPTAGSVNPVTSEGIKEYVDSHSGTTYTAGQNITIKNNVISAKDTVYTAGEGIDISNDIISIVPQDKTEINFLKNAKPCPSNTLPIFKRSDKNVFPLTDNGYNVKLGWQFNGHAYASVKGYNAKLNNDTMKWEKFHYRVLSNNEYFYDYFDTDLIGGDIINFNNKVYYIRRDSYYMYEIKEDAEGIYFEEIEKTTFFNNVLPQKFLRPLGGADYWENNGVFSCFSFIYGGTYYNIILEPSVSSDWTTKTFSGFNNILGRNIWIYNNNICYSEGTTQFIYNKETGQWTQQSWSVPTSGFDGSDIWTDGNDIYCSYSTENLGKYSFVLDKNTPFTWLHKTWNERPTSLCGAQVLLYNNKVFYLSGDYRILINSDTWWKAEENCNPFFLTGFSYPDNAKNIWTDGLNFYFSSIEMQYKFNASTQEWEKIHWKNNNNFNGYQVWLDYNNNVYCESYRLSYDQTILGATYNGSHSWEYISPTHQYSSFVLDGSGEHVWSDGEIIYYSYQGDNKILDRTNGWLNVSMIIPAGVSINGGNIWSDGEEIYCFYVRRIFKFIKNTREWVEDTSNWNLSDVTDSLYGNMIWTFGKDLFIDTLNFSTMSNLRHYRIDTKTKQIIYFTSDYFPTSSPGSTFNLNRAIWAQNIWNDGEHTYCFPDLIAYGISNVKIKK